MNKKKKLLIKICSFLSIVGLAVLSLTSKTYAYTYDVENDTLTSENVLNNLETSGNAVVYSTSDSLFLNWRGAVSNVTFDIVPDNSQGSYTLSGYKDGVGYAWYQFYWVYSDESEERITNNQSINDGYAYFTSDNNKILTGLYCVCNFDTNFQSLMLNKGTSAISFETYGAIFYGSNNYENAYQRGFYDGKDSAIEENYNAINDSYNNGYQVGFSVGDTQGYNRGVQASISSTGFPYLIQSIFNYPINMVRSVFDFEFMGINIKNMIMFVLSLFLIFFVIRKFGGKE